MRWDAQKLSTSDGNALPGLARPAGLVRSVQTPEFAGMTFHEVLAKSALNRVPGGSEMPFGWTINPYRGCSHACTYCFARPTHAYLELNAGEDFDRQVVVKTNVAEVLRRELARPSWRRDLVALGTNTDPYQRAEGRYRLMPSIIDALAQSRTPFSVLTKGTLLRRDIPRLEDAARHVSVDVAMSIAVYDDELQASVEPGTPTPTARLATVKAVREAGLECGVFLMPILPYLTDSTEQLDYALRRVKEAGASYALFSTLYLKPGVKPWFMMWLQRQHPELMSRYNALYAEGAYAPKQYRAELAERVRPLLRTHGLERRRGVRFEEQPRTAAPVVLPAPADAAHTLF
ncbi:Rv2578c family radical SAM protein [Paramicrobacterium agarici]|uniref:Rv2578c family radical SAM protein n=1 Tax=Paramicrobacterium agarici TaxID=630514 RepID=UPI00114F5628|nr:Rv2578c family radical SAM protein [Microbacterium agarici]TQO23425.1 DNA repair photolyase [Microbacterium agarici]